MVFHYATRVLKSYSRDALLPYIPQIVQTIRWDRDDCISDLIQSLASSSQLLAHQFLWNMNTNMYEDENAKRKDKDLYKSLNDISTKVLYLSINIE
jgi:phosphatidylinositol 4-kinase